MGTTKRTLYCYVQIVGKIRMELTPVPNAGPIDREAYSSRDAKFVMNVHARWENSANDDKCISWVRRFFKPAAPYASEGAYVNFMTEEE